MIHKVAAFLWHFGLIKMLSEEEETSFTGGPVPDRDRLMTEDCPNPGKKRGQTFSAGRTSRHEQDEVSKYVSAMLTSLL